MSVPGWLQERVARATGGQGDGAGDRAARAVLTAGSFAYGAAVAARNAAYDAGWLRVHRLPCRVLCVGNITVGGTGKTPTVLALAEALLAAGRRPCILLRGYAGGEAGPAVVSDGRGVLLDWPEAGDEAVLLARRVAGVPVVVGADRVRAGRAALERFGPDVILLDDGFQHRRLHRDVDLVLLDARDPFGGGRLLPRGRLREPRSALRRARAILVTRADRIGERSGLARAIRDAAGKVPIGWARHRPAGVVDLATGLVEPPGPLGGRRAFAVSGIAAPESLLGTLAELGARVVGARAFPDHHPFDEDDRRGIVRAARAAGADCIVTTEKDAVRLGTVASEGLRVLAVRIALEVMEGGAALCGVLGVCPGERDG